MFLDWLRKFVWITSELEEINDGNSSIREVVGSVWEKTNSLIKNKKIKSISKFYINYQILLSEEIKNDKKISDIDALNSIIADSENLRIEIEEENDVYLLEWYKEDILDIMFRKKELLKSNSDIEEWLNALIKVINSRIKIVSSNIKTNDKN